MHLVSVLIHIFRCYWRPTKNCTFMRLQTNLSKFWPRPGRTSVMELTGSVHRISSGYILASEPEDVTQCIALQNKRSTSMWDNFVPIRFWSWFYSVAFSCVSLCWKKLMDLQCWITLSNGCDLTTIYGQSGWDPWLQRDMSWKQACVEFCRRKNLSAAHFNNFNYS